MATDRWARLAWASTVLLLVLCLMPGRVVASGPEGRRGIPNVDKAVHFAMFAAFGVCWTRAGTPGRGSAAKAARVVAAGLALTVGTELAQGLEFVHRDPDALDALADALGLALGVGLAVRRGAVGGGDPP